MAFANEVEEFGQDIKFHIGERVRLIVDEVLPEEIACDTGIITKMDTRHMHTPKFRAIVCTLRMDGEFFKNPMFGGLKEIFATDVDHLEKIPK